MTPKEASHVVGAARDLAQAPAGARERGMEFARRATEAYEARVLGRPIRTFGEGAAALVWMLGTDEGKAIFRQVVEEIQDTDPPA